MARLLIIPGDNETLRGLSDTLADEAQVQVFDNANDALWEIRHTPPDVVAADLNLPGMSGLDLAEIIPNFGVATRVVLWSRESDRDAARQAENAGVHRFLDGPQSPDAVRQVLLQALHTTPAPPAPVVESPPPPPPPTPKPSLAARAAATGRASNPPAERPRPEQPDPPPPPVADPLPTARRTHGRRREGALVFTADALTPIRSRLSDLNQEIGAQCILLTDRAGMVLTEVGVTRGIPTMILLPLLSTAFSTAGQISQVLREKDSNALYMQEGSHYDLYCFDVMQTYMLVIIFDRGVLASKIGTVWVYAKRAMRDIQEYLV
jgi:CheY-like chemotaxis protein